MFFEHNFRPLRITKLGDSAGFLTGYYEPIVDGSRVPNRNLQSPNLPPSAGSGAATKRHRVPAFLTGDSRYGGRPAANWCHTTLAARSSTAHLTASIWRSAGSRIRRTLCRFRSRGRRVSAWRTEQCCASTTMPITDTHTLPVGRILIERNIIPREEMSLERIREWMRANPESAEEVRRQNRSFVFFRIVGLSDDREAVGAPGHTTNARKLDCRRQLAACVRHAVFHRGRSAAH